MARSYKEELFMTLYNLEQTYLYGGGCQMEEENQNIQCACGHACFASEVKEIGDKTICPDCYEEVLKVDKLLKKFVRGTFTDDELKIISDFNLLEDLANGILNGVVSAQ